MLSKSEVDPSSHGSQTAQEFITEQLRLEADAKEALPFRFTSCTRELRPARQSVLSCLTCNPPPTNPTDYYRPAGICYACSISCHGEHELVELFSRRNFTCDCGTTRISSETPCRLRLDPATGQKGEVHGEAPSFGNKYNQNFHNNFCGCGEKYDAQREEGTMYQCLGLAPTDEGGCGEDWWHPECIVGSARVEEKAKYGDEVSKVQNSAELGVTSLTNSRYPNPTESVRSKDRFPNEADFEHFVCYKCTEAFPFIKNYATAPGFTFRRKNSTSNYARDTADQIPGTSEQQSHGEQPSEGASCTIKLGKHSRVDDETGDDSQLAKKVKLSLEHTPQDSFQCKLEGLDQCPAGPVSIFCPSDFRERFCRCSTCFNRLKAFPQLLEEEDVYEPSLDSDLSAESNSENNLAGSIGSRSLLDRGEAALSNLDRVRAIEGAMAYNNLRDGLKDFFRPYVESGKAVSAEDIKQYFEKLRGDDEGIRSAAVHAHGPDSTDDKPEQSGY